MKLENPQVHLCWAGESPPHQLRASAESQRPPEPLPVTFQRGAECCPHHRPFSGPDTPRLNTPLCSSACHILNSRSVVVFMDERPAFHTVGSAKKNWKSLHWLVQPRPPKGPTSFPSLCEEERLPYLGRQKCTNQKLSRGTLHSATMKTLTAGATPGTPAAPHIRHGRSDCGTYTLLSAIIHAYSINSYQAHTPSGGWVGRGRWSVPT